MSTEPAAAQSAIVRLESEQDNKDNMIKLLKQVSRDAIGFLVVVPLFFLFAGVPLLMCMALGPVLLAIWFQEPLMFRMWKPWDKEAVVMAAPMAYILLVHGWRYILVRADSDSKHRISEYPDASSFVLERASGLTILSGGAGLLLWVMLGSKSSQTNYYLPIATMTVALLSWLMAKYEYLYGYEVAGTRLRTLLPSSHEYEQQQENPVARHQVPTLRFSDIYGNTEIKHRLLEAAQTVIKPKSSKKQRNGILLAGDPGNGKTFLAEALAGELRLHFLTLTHSDVASQWVGERTVRIKAAFDQAIRTQPCLLFLDEFDSFIPDRSLSSGTSNREDQDVVNSLLTLLVDIRKHRVVVVAATNYPDRLDTAAVREGRFDFKVEITPPDKEARVGLLTHGLKMNVPNAQVDPATVQDVAQRWNGFSVKRIQAVTEEMPFYLDDLAKQGQKRTSLEYDDFMACLRRIQGSKGAAPENVKAMADLILPDVTREAIDMLAGRLRDPLRVERLGGTLPSGVLFFGPPGTGKTVTCKALAKEVDWAFLIETGTDLARNPTKLDKLYAKAKELRPTIIFIDEADDLVRSREYSSNTEATNKLLTLMDGVNDRVRDVVWVAATNHPDQIDPALLRGGRFTEKVEFVRPGEHQLTNLIAKWLQERKIALAAGLQPADVANMMGDESIANAEAVLQYAVNRAISTATADNISVNEADIRRGIEMVLGASE